MKRYLFYGLMFALGLNMAACHKDTGNYDYHEINRITFSNIDTVQGYQVLFGEPLSINPAVNASMEASGDYTYQWSWAIAVKTGGLRDSVIANTKNLTTTVKLAPGVYSLQYRVTDNKTGVTFHTRASVNVVTSVYEGYMLLNEVGGKSRLDMLSYNKAANTFTQFTDVLQKMGSTVPMNGTPYQVYCTTFLNPTVAGNYGIFILNSAGCNRVDQETFAYDPTLMNIKNLFVGTPLPNFTPIHMVQEGVSSVYPVIYLFDNTGNIYSYATFAGNAFHYAPLNVYSAAGTPFKVAPYGVTNSSVGVFYNNDKKNFVVAASYSGAILTDAATTLKYPTGMEMVFMDKDYNNNVFAILKDPVTSKLWLLKFAIGGAQTYFMEILGTDIATASHFALNPQFGYLFYSSGSKVYEYDQALQTSVLMIDKGPDATITYLNFHHFFNRTNSTVNKANYAIWANYLSVASYRGADGSGTFGLYVVPPVNGQITKFNEWTGFGKIVSVSYRER